MDRTCDRHHMLPIPGPIWQRQISRNGEGNRAALGFMSEDHHRVRDFAVVKLPRASASLPSELFAERLSLPLAHVVAILDELERHMTFLFMNTAGAVTWAYQVTVDPTPHRISCCTDGQLRAAERSQHHRCVLNELRLLLVRRTRKRSAAQGRRRVRHLSDIKSGRLRHADRAGWHLWPPQVILLQRQSEVRMQ
jgi:hypothetical protein